MVHLRPPLTSCRSGAGLTASRRALSVESPPTTGPEDSPLETTGRSGSPHEGEDRQNDQHEDNDAHDADAADPFCKHGAPFVGGANCPDDTARAPSGSFAVGLMHPYPHAVAGKRKETGQPLVPVNVTLSMNAPRDRPMPYARAVDIAPVLVGSSEGNAEGF